MDTTCAFWQAGSETVAKAKASATFNHSISPIENVKPSQFGNDDIEFRIEEEGDELKEADDKRERTAEEEVERFERRSKQPGASLQKRNAPNPRESGNQTVPNPHESGDQTVPQVVPNPPEGGKDFEVRHHKVGNRPTLPTKAEIAAHYPLHLNYRSWCKHCVAGKARSNPHRSKDPEEESLGITLHADYASMGGEYKEEEEGMQASLIMFDDDKESFWAVGIDRKGASEAMIKFSVGVVDQSGYVGENLTFNQIRSPALFHSNRPLRQLG